MKRACICLAITLWIAPSLTSSATLFGQDSPKKPVQGRAQKLTNPLNDLLAEAQRDIDKNDFESAIAPLQKVLADQPDFAYAHFQMGYVFTALKRNAEARAEYERTISLDPKMAEANLNLGLLLLDGQPADAVAPLRKAVELLPAQSRPRFLLGVALERTGEKAAAVESFEAASGLDPHDFDTLVHLGNAYLDLKRAPEAEKKYRSALEIQSNYAPALLGLAQSLDAQKKPEAAEVYGKYLSAQPADAAVRGRLVHLLLDQQQYDDALAELDRAAAGQAPTVESLKLRADIQIAQKHLDDAIATLKQAIALVPGDAQLHGGLGRLFLEERDFASAEKELNAALQLEKNNVIYWKDLSSTFYLAGNYPATLTTLDVVAKLETPGPGAWFIRALCYDKLNQTRPALEAYQKFLELAPDKNSDQVWQAQQRSKVLQRMLDRKR
jgi:tetratricopeptide (TPR) repeat protein